MNSELILKAIIIDDEPLAVRSLSSLIEKYTENVEILTTATNALQGIKEIAHYQPDIVFLDVNMPGGSGIQMLEALPQRDFSVIFTTASADYAIQALKNYAIDYLLKPIDIDELIVAIEKVRSLKSVQQKRYPEKLALPTIQGVKIVPINSIIYIEANDNYTHFVLEGEKTKLIISKTLKEFEVQLPHDIFCRIHQSFIVNLNYIDTYVRGRGGQLILKDGTILEVSARKKDDLFKRLFS